MSFTKSVFTASYVIMSKSMKSRKESDLTDYLKLIDPMVWCCILISYIILIAINRLESYLFELRKQVNIWHIIQVSLNQRMFL